MKHQVCNALVMVICFTFVTATAAQVPINPITMDVKENIKKSVRVVSQIEDSMAPKVSEVAKLKKSYEPCKGNESDKGCVAIKRDLGHQYAEVLRAVDDVLPNVQKSVNATANSLGVSIYDKTKRKDIKQLYDSISQKKNAPKARGPLSKKLNDLLVSLGGGSNVSVLELSLRTQSDLVAAAEIVEFLQAKVSQLLLMVELGQELPILSPEMTEIMQGVANLFGYEMDFGVEIEEPALGPGVSDGDDWRF